MFRTRTVPADDLSEALAPRVAAAREAALDALAPKLAPKLAQAREAVAPPLASARDRLAPRVETVLDTTRQVANERVLPAAEVARDRLAPVVNRAADAILEAVLPAVTAAAEAYEKSQAVEEIRRRGEAAVATLRTEGPEFARRRWPLIAGLVLGGALVGGLAGAVSRKRAAEPAWTPPPVIAAVPPAPPAPPIAPVAEMGPGAAAEETAGLGDLGLSPEPPSDATEQAAAQDPEGLLPEAAAVIDPAEAEATRSEQ